MTLVGFWFVNTVDVEPRTDEGTYGATYGTKQTVSCWIEGESKLVRDSNGAEVVSSSSVYMSVADAASFPIGSRVTLPDGTTTHVITNNTFDSGSLALGLDHAVIHLA